MELLLLIPSLILAYLLWQANRDHREDRKAWTVERLDLLTAREEERQVWVQERKELNQRIQAPELAVRENWERKHEGRQYVPFDDDEAFWEQQRQVNGDGH